MKDINLFEGIKKSAPPKKASKAVSAGVVVLVLAAVILGGIYGWLRYTEKNLDTQIASLNQQLGASGGSDVADVQNSKLAALQSYNHQLDVLGKGIKSYPVLNAALLADIAGRLPADMTVQSISYELGVLTLTCLADKTDSPAIFAGALKTSPYIGFVNFKRSWISISQDSDAGASESKVQFLVECYLKGGVVK